jgi:fermentation-respiration switch protein FrsA (DUF1100 family)
MNSKEYTITFDSGGLKLAGILRVPPEQVSGLRPAIIVGHPASGVKEQAAGTYALRLAEQGFITLTFDTGTQGESEGLPRGVEDPARRVEEFKNAVSYLSVLCQVDPDRIGVLGICASGGYAIAAAATDHRIKAVATVSAADIGALFRYGADGKQASSIIQGMLAAASAARSAEALGEGVGMLPLFPTSEEQARAGGLHVFEGWEYYSTGSTQHPRSAKAFTWNSVDRMVAFAPFAFIDMIAPRPLLMIVGTEAVTKWMSTKAFDTALEPKELFWIEDATHVGLYDKPEYVSRATTKLGDFFHERLSAQSQRNGGQILAIR